MDYDLLDDHGLVDGILNNDKKIIEYFFQRKCSKLISYILINVFDGNIDKREITNELFLFLAEKDWNVFRLFKFRSSLMTYVSVVAVRFFQKKRILLMEKSQNSPLSNKRNILKHDVRNVLDRKIDIQSAINKIPNIRYRKVIEILDLRDVRPELLAEEMDITVDNLYNIHRRALIQLRLVMGRKEDYND